MSAMGGRFDGWHVLDLFAGSGALGLECLSRGAAHVTFVERASSSLAVLRRNVQLVDAGDRCRVVRADVFRWLEDLPEPARGDGSGRPLPEVALADPPYGRGLASRLVKVFARTPFANALWVEHAVRDELPEVPGMERRRYGDIVITTVESRTLQSRNRTEP